MTPSNDSKERLTTFAETSPESYDRHTYTIVWSDGTERDFDDYESMRSYWWSHGMIMKATVRVNDRKKGFA